jgi:hypothetical protein
MTTDEQLRDGLRAMLQSAQAPAISLEQIHRRMQAPMQYDRRPFAIGAAAAAALAVAVALPIASPGVVQTLEQKIAAILQWSPPPSPPASVVNSIEPQTVTLAEAQTRVKFTIVAPQGVPSDATGPTIEVAPTGVYSSNTGKWTAGGPKVITFEYKRGNGRSFLVTAKAVSSTAPPAAKYVFEDKGVDKAGNPILIKHERFAWRNGDQVMGAIAGDGITAAEIIAIQTAMHGTPIPGVWPVKHGGFDVMWQKIPKPR